MLRACLRLLRPGPGGLALAEGACQALAAASAEPSQAALALSAQRLARHLLSSSAGPGGSSGDGGGQEPSASSQLTQSSRDSAFVSPDVALQQWGDAMDKGDWERAWEVFEASFPVDTPEFPSVEQLFAEDLEAEERAARRAREMELQEETAARRVRSVDAWGRAHAAGKRKTAIARVWLKPGGGLVMVNRRPYDSYFPDLARRNDLITPFIVTNTLGGFDVMASVAGGGPTGQAQALRHGISRALQLYDPAWRAPLKAAGLLTRDARVVERKKPGRKKARKAFQWVKR